jgi:hypothetical protein
LSGIGDPARAAEAAELYTGDLLERYEHEWLVVERERLRMLYLDALRDLCAAARKRRDFAVPIRYAVPPFTNAPFTYTLGVSTPTSLAADAYGQFYAADSGASYVQVFSPPFVITNIGYYGSVSHPAAVAAWP